MRIDSRQPHFPPLERAASDGLLMTGGSLSPEWMLAGYRSGIFPMPIDMGWHTELAWFSPDPRGILELDELYVSSRLARRLRRGEFQFSVDRAFSAVASACAEPRPDDTGRWITPAMHRAYVALHEIGVAHSVEVWRGDELVGGTFGLAIGGFFAGESMFHRATDASKAALVHLCSHLRDRGFTLFDIQWTTPHTLSLGARDIPRAEYLARLRSALELPVAW